jgi:hypothetical protein
LGDVNFSFGFQVFKGPKGEEIHRPMMPVTLAYRGTKVQTWLLVDSGADFSMIQREFAEGMLGIDIDSLQDASTSSVGGAMRVKEATVEVAIEDNVNSRSFEAVFQIPVDRPNFPILQLIGRDPLFYLFDVNFRMGFTNEIGKFVLRWVESRRKASRYSIGGVPLKDRRR